MYLGTPRRTTAPDRRPPRRPREVLAAARANPFEPVLVAPAVPLGGTRLDPIVIIGAGPAGVSAALELTRSGAPVVVVEQQDVIGGISRTIPHEGALFDVGPHRFFTKNQEVQALWEGALPEDFLSVDRLTRIYYQAKLLAYPISISDTLAKVGPLQAAGFGFSFLAAQLRGKLAPREPVTFEDWVVASFGRKLFEAFFKTYTEKVWGIPCSQIGAEWAGQRIKGLSLWEAVRSALLKPRDQVKTLVEQFRFPRLGAGMMYERFAALAAEKGAQFALGARVTGIRLEGPRAVAVQVERDGHAEEIPCSFVLTSNPVTEVALTLSPAAPAPVQEAARALRYRCHMCVNLLVEGDLFPDQWVYVHAKEVVLGRIANYANFSPAMRGPARQTPVTVEYFQFPDDALYASPDPGAVIEHAKRELKLMGLLDPARVTSGFVVRSPAAYPVLDLAYAPRLQVIRQYLDTLDNLQPMGRGGMFKYNNQDHSIATGLLAARNALGAHHDVWAVNIDAEYHESGKAN
jgi:protoporphyrinogen oxidase